MVIHLFLLWKLGERRLCPEDKSVFMSKNRKSMPSPWCAAWISNQNQSVDVGQQFQALHLLPRSRTDKLADSISSAFAPRRQECRPGPMLRPVLSKPFLPGLLGTRPQAFLVAQKGTHRPWKAASSFDSLPLGETMAH